MYTRKRYCGSNTRLKIWYYKRSWTTKPYTHL